MDNETIDTETKVFEPADTLNDLICYFTHDIRPLIQPHEIPVIDEIVKRIGALATRCTDLLYFNRGDSTEFYSKVDAQINHVRDFLSSELFSYSILKSKLEDMYPIIENLIGDEERKRRMLTIEATKEPQQRGATRTREKFQNQDKQVLELLIPKWINGEYDGSKYDDLIQDLQDEYKIGRAKAIRFYAQANKIRPRLGIRKSFLKKKI